MKITPHQCRAARGLLSISQQDLAKMANVGLSTVRSFENEKSTPITNNIQAIQTALENAGVNFIDNGVILSNNNK
ncbi:helix-turn-helix domain-containing protein [Commensalibacter communis]|uniref:helix-turn-helix domain-containing protein n=1 Tax=Commensalibacter communis TaxID=2972786 RepID=UPI0022FFB67C|nr:helix-turn-helix transcriptional regulator [Commensalibacter communis]CAI3933264.1 Archaeal ribosome-binding protein aMBF1 [Commensalibacter communis]CAI3944929.1 Archaeal ribosome-binding protein aMBF1 [Commensalibacter communis]